MACKLNILNLGLKRALGFAETDEVLFDSFAEFEQRTPVGTELLISDSAGDFIATFKGFAFGTDDRLFVRYGSQFGNGSTRVEDVRGWVTDTLLQSNSGTLGDQARARLVLTVQPVAEISPIEQVTPTPEQIGYDERESSIKIEQFESTTGQDVANERDGTLDDRPSTLAKMLLRESVANRPRAYRVFIVKDSGDYYNDLGVLPTGEVLLVVHAAAYDSLVAELGRPATQQELLSVAVRISDEFKIAAEGNVFTLAMEGSLSGEDSFFKRSHDERLVAYATKYDKTLEEAEAHFREGQRKMREARRMAAKAPVPVNVKSVSMGSFTGESMPSNDFLEKYGLEDAAMELNLGSSGVKGRYYIVGEVNGQTVRMLTVPVSLRAKYGEVTLWEMVTRLPDLNPAELGFLKSIFGVNRRKKGPYFKGDKLFSAGVEIITEGQFSAALDVSDWPALSDKRGEGVATMMNGMPVTNSTFILEHTNTDGDLWQFNGSPVPYAANRYFYLDLSTSTVSAVSISQDDRMADAYAEIMAVPDEYYRIFTSSEPDDVRAKLLLPRLFTPQFEASVSRLRMLEGAKASSQQGTERYAVGSPVGGRYFGSKSVVSRLIPIILRKYLKADLIRLREIAKRRSLGDSAEYPPFHLVWFPTQIDVDGLNITGTTSDEQLDVLVEQNLLRTIGGFRDTLNMKVAEELERLHAEGISDVTQLGVVSKEDLKQTLYTIFANQLVANAEMNIMFGSNVFGNVPEVSPTFWNSQKEGTSVRSVVTGLPSYLNPEVRTTSNEGRYMTLDNYRTWTRSVGRWTEEMEQQYQREVSQFSGQDVVGEMFPATSVQLTYSGPVSVQLTADSSIAPLLTEITFSAKYEVLIPSKLGDNEGLHRTLLQSGGITHESEVVLYLQNFVEVQAEEGRQVDRELAALESSPVTSVGLENSDIFQYALSRLGKTFAAKLMNSDKTVTFEDVDRYAAEVGNGKFTFTRFNTAKDFALSDSTSEMILSGEKTLTLRKRGEDYAGANNSGLVQLDSKIFDVQEVGELTLVETAKALNVSTQQVAQMFLGKDGSIDSIFDADVRKYFADGGKRRVFTIRELGKQQKKKRITKRTVPCKLF